MSLSSLETSPLSSLRPSSPLRSVQPTSPLSSLRPSSPLRPIQPTSPLSSLRPSSPLSSSSSESEAPTTSHSPLPFTSHRSPLKRQRRRPRKSNRQSPHTRTQKLQSIHELIKRRGWKMTDLLAAYAQESQLEGSQAKDFRKFWLQFKRFAYRDVLEDREKYPALSSKEWGQILKAGGSDQMVHILRTELKQLGKLPSAGGFQFPEAAESLDLGSLAFIEPLRRDIVANAPHLSYLLSMLPRPSHQSGHAPMDFGPRQVIWTVMFMFSMQRKKCNSLPRLFGMYFVNSGVKKRVVDTLSTIGLCVSYSTVHECMKGIADIAEAQVRILGPHKTRLNAYDNYDFAEHKHGERLGQKKKFITLTNGVLVAGQYIPPTGLCQSMWRPHIPLRATDIARKISEFPFHREVRQHTVYLAIKAGLPGAFDEQFLKRVEHLGMMPKVEEIAVGPTRYHPYAPVFENEGTNEGNVTIQANYEEKQCGLAPDDQRWSQILTPYYGDLKTVQRILSVQDMRKLTAQDAYDKKEWMVPGLGLWHLRLNMLKLIHKIHWGGPRPQDASTLQFAADSWDRSNVNVPSDFKKLEDLLIHSHHSRVLGLLFHNASKQFDRREDAEAWLRERTTVAFENKIGAIIDLVNPRGFDNPGPDPPLNMNWYNHQCFIRHMDVYFILRHAIKFADIGLLRQALREACIMFQAKEGQTFNYGPELLRLMHLYDSDAAKPSLQRAMLANGLVNLRGIYGKTFEIDRLVEFLNGFVAIVRKDRASSTKSIADLLRQVTLTAPYMLQLKQRLESQFGRAFSGEHPSKDASEDIWMMSLTLQGGDYMTMDEEVFSVFRAINLIGSGYGSLGDNVVRYNERKASGLSTDDNIQNEGDILVSDGQPEDTMHGAIETMLEGLT